jgi:hypothetical protein
MREKYLDNNPNF